VSAQPLPTNFEFRRRTRKWQNSRSVKYHHGDTTAGLCIIHTENVGERDLPTGILDVVGLEEVQQPSQLHRAVRSARRWIQSKEGHAAK
jgi:hypothetical protein